VGDKTITSEMDRKTIRKAMPKYSGIEFMFLEDGNVFNYQHILQELPDHSIILAMHVNTDNTGKYYSFEESFDIYSQIVFEGKLPLTCPHGRPYVYTMTRKELAGKFLRG